MYSKLANKLTHTHTQTFTPHTHTHHSRMQRDKWKTHTTPKAFLLKHTQTRICCMHMCACVCVLFVVYVCVRILFTQKSRLKAQSDIRKRWKQVNISLNKRAMIEKLTSHGMCVCVCVSLLSVCVCEYESTEMSHGTLLKRKAQTVAD